MKKLNEEPPIADVKGKTLNIKNLKKKLKKGENDESANIIFREIKGCVILNEDDNDESPLEKGEKIWD